LDQIIFWNYWKAKDTLLKRYKPRYPSESDRKITHKIKEAGLLMDIQLLDHLIILPVEGYYSFADDKQSSPS
jgi:hypothetical protein